MNMERFRELSAAYGAQRRRWPAADHALHAAGASTPEGARLLAEAAALDALLDTLQTRPEDPLRAARIARAARAPAARRRLVRWVSAAYAASALLGFTLGFTELDSSDYDTPYSGLLLGSSVIEEFL